MAGLQLKYFVLNPSKNNEFGEASREAMITYADSIKETEPELAEDLLNWVDTALEDLDISASICIELED